MKSLNTILALALIAAACLTTLNLSTATAQEGEAVKTEAEAKTGEKKTYTMPKPTVKRDTPSVVFGSDAHNGGYGGPVLKFTEIHDTGAVMVGGRGGWLLDHTLMLGGGGYGLANDVVADNIFENNARRYIEVGYGGFIAEATFLSQHLVHMSADLLIGAGGVSYSERYNDSLDNDFDIESSGFFVTEFGLNIELNLSKHVRMSAGPSYRFVEGVNLRGLNDSDLSGFAGTFMVKFGAF